MNPQRRTNEHLFLRRERAGRMEIQQVPSDRIEPRHQVADAALFGEEARKNRMDVYNHLIYGKRREADFYKLWKGSTS